ncbi:MAG: DUF2490 domain-containing protein [Sphingobium sp.]
MSLRVARFLSPLAALLCCLSSAARAETVEDEQAWLNITAIGPISGKLVYFAEVQPRLGDGLTRIDQLLLRGAVGWKLLPSLTLYQGYAHVRVPRDDGPDIDEERSFQQISWTIGKPLGGELSSRTRLEQRWRNDGDDMGWRLREMLRYEAPLKAGSDAVNALVWGEAFVALNDTDWGARSGFDQLRSFVGVELGLPGASTAEIGYMNQLFDRRGGVTRMNHIASVTLFFRR